MLAYILNTYSECDDINFIFNEPNIEIAYELNKIS